MKNKKILAIMAFALLMSFSAALAQAQTAAPNAAANAPAMTAEEMAKFEPLWLAHQKKMEPLRDSMWAQQMKYDALVGNPNTKQETVDALIADMMKTKGQLRAERNSFKAELTKNGFDKFGHGHGNCWSGEAKGQRGDYGGRHGAYKSGGNRNGGHHGCW